MIKGIIGITIEILIMIIGIRLLVAPFIKKKADSSGITGTMLLAAGGLPLNPDIVSATTRIKAINGKLMFPDDFGGKYKAFIVSYDNPVDIRIFMQMIQNGELGEYNVIHAKKQE